MVNRLVNRHKRSTRKTNKNLAELNQKALNKNWQKFRAQQVLNQASWNENHVLMKNIPRNPKLTPMDKYEHMYESKITKNKRFGTVNTKNEELNRKVLNLKRDQH